MNEIWNAIADHLREHHQDLYVNVSTYHGDPYIFLQRTSRRPTTANDRLMFTLADSLQYAYCIRHQIDLNDPNLLDNIDKTIKEWHNTT